MTLFRDALRGLRQGYGLKPRLRAVPFTVSVSERIISDGPGSDKPREGRNYDLVSRALLSSISNGGALSWREARDGAWCLWATTPALADWRESLTAVVDGVSASDRKQPFRALASSWMASFEPEREGVAEASVVLRQKAPSMGRPWATLHSAYDLFHPANGPANVAGAALKAKVSPPEVLRRNGLGAFNSDSGYAKACTAAVLHQLADGLEKDPQRRLEIVRSMALGPQERLIFPEHGPLVANALLRPFGAAMPEKGLRDTFLALLISLFKDPRLNPGGWTRMREAEAVVKRWLTEQSLRQFLDVVDQVALERMWKYRRAFWEAVYRADLISEAWVVFDSAGSRVARHRFGKQIAFAGFQSGVQNGQAVLLMKVGRGVVAEWSHNGKCIVWSDADARSAPRLNRPEYSVHDLRAPSIATDNITGEVFAVSHMNAEGYGWQWKVANKIHQMTGVRLPQSTYSVR